MAVHQCACGRIGRYKITGMGGLYGSSVRSFVAARIDGKGGALFTTYAKAASWARKVDAKWRRRKAARKARRITRRAR